MQAARDEMQWAEEGPPPLLVKIAPDLSKQDLDDIAAVICFGLSIFFFFFFSHFTCSMVLFFLSYSSRLLLLFDWMAW